MFGRILKILLAVAVVLVIGLAIFLGLHFFSTELPRPRDAGDPVPAVVDFSPRRAAIPWKRDLGDTAGVKPSPAWLPWEKAPPGVTPVNGVLPLPPGFPNQRADAELLRQISVDLASPDAAVYAAALDKTRTIAREQPLSALAQLRNAKSPWSRPLLDARRAVDLDALAASLIIRCAHDTLALESLLTLRARAALQLDRGDDALRHARELFALSTMPNTAPSITLLLECLPAESSRTLRDELTTARASAQLVLTANHPDQQEYARQADALIAVDIATVTARGNLLLLAGRPDDARRAFRRACAIATDAQLPVAADALARCEKARAGSIKGTP